MWQSVNTVSFHTRFVPCPGHTCLTNSHPRKYKGSHSSLMGKRKKAWKSSARFCAQRLCRVRLQEFRLQ